MTRLPEQIQHLFDARASDDRTEAYDALVTLFAITEAPVPWAYDVWDELVEQLDHRDGHVRAFAAQLLARLALSDPEERILRDFPQLQALLYDERTVTARHTLQSIWRVGLAGDAQRERVMQALKTRFEDCTDLKHASMVRSDIIIALAALVQATESAPVQELAESLIASVDDPGLTKKLRAAWRKALR